MDLFFGFFGGFSQGMKKPVCRCRQTGFFIPRWRAYCTSTARLSLIFFCQIAGPVM